MKPIIALLFGFLQILFTFEGSMKYYWWSLVWCAVVLGLSLHERYVKSKRS